MSIYYTGAAGNSPPQVNNTGPGPRQPMGLPPGPHGASPPPQATVPLTQYGQQGTAQLAPRLQQGTAVLPRSVGGVPTDAQFGYMG